MTSTANSNDGKDDKDDLGGSAAPRLHVRLRSEEGIVEELVPLRIPRQLEVSFDELGADQIDELQLEAQLDLNAGSYELPIGEDMCLSVAVPDSAHCQVWALAGRAGAGARAMVTEAGLKLNRPLVLGGVLPVLYRLHTLFKDHELAALLDKIKALTEGSSAGAIRRLRDSWAVLAPQLEQVLLPGDSPWRHTVQQLWGSLEQLSEQTEQLVIVMLSQVSVRPVRREGRRELEIGFTGEVRYRGRVQLRFTDLVLPRQLIPAPHAALGRLLSDEPLASAELRSERLQIPDLLEQLTRAISTFSGSLVAAFDLPEAVLETELADGGRLELAALSGVRRALCEGRFSGSLAEQSLTVHARNLRVKLGTSGTLRGDAKITARTCGDGGSVCRRWLSWVRDPSWPPPGLALELVTHLAAGSQVPWLRLRAGYEHPLATGGLKLPLELRDLVLSGEWSAAIEPGSGGWPSHRGDLHVAGELAVPAGGVLSDGRTEIHPTVTRGSFSGEAQWTDTQGLELLLSGTAELQLEGRTQVEAFPELAIEDGVLTSVIRGRAQAEGRVRTSDLTQALVEVSFCDSSLQAELDQVEAQLGPRRLTLPAGATLQAQLSDSVLNTSGLGRGAVDVAWDLRGQSPVLAGPSEQVELLVPALRRGRFAVEISPAGGLTIRGEERGLYDARFFNALVNPGSEPGRWLEIMLDDEAIERVLSAVRIFSGEAAELLAHLRRFALSVQGALDAEGITKPGDLIPGRTIAQVLSRIIHQGTTELTDRLHPLVKRVTDGDGLDIPAVRRILDEHLPEEHDYGYELDGLLRLAALLLSPTEPVPPRRKQPRPPLTEEPELTRRLAALPTAAELYATVCATAPLPAGFTQRLRRVAPYLTLEQLSYLLEQDRADWPAEDLAPLRYILQLKQRVRLISDNYGGLSFAPQATAIGFFLGEAARIRAGGSADGGAAEAFAELAELLPDCVLGPQDVAALLQAGLASTLQGQRVQLNRRLLLDLILAQPPWFLSEVLVELAGGSARALTGVLNALLDPPQDRMREPLDLADLFSARLGISMPRLEHYMAGGRHAKHSFWEALSVVAEQILAEAEPYLAKKAWLQVCRRPAAAPLTLDRPELLALAERAQQQIAAADACGRQVAGPEGLLPAQDHEAARRAYEEAFFACAALLEAEPQAFQLGWLKAFWGRSYEALMVRSVVRNAQEDSDDVRRWLSARGGLGDFDFDLSAEQQLVGRVIDALYYRPADRAQLKADPLVRLLIDPPAGHYDFTVISAMGVITEGAQGTELDAAYQRLKERRGIDTIRANTATARTTDYNAARIEEAVRQARTPWGYIGYSQGCANDLQAESRLLGGTPKQQALAAGLRGRNLLFSAVNGSAHGTCGDLKFLRAVIQADRFMKHYQAVFSSQAIRFFLQNLRMLMDSRLFVHALGGVASLSYEGVQALCRDGQFKPDVPTSIIRGIVEEETLPEALEFLGHVLSKQIGTTTHDTQVEVDEAVGHSVLVDNISARVLERCDMGALIQRTHHWSPLRQETEFITTERDRRLAIYDVPKDRHVFPWIEVSARFGLIKTKTG